MASSKPPRNDSFPFLSLPGELRQMVYRELLVPEKARSSGHRIHRYYLQPSILRTNKQIYQEAVKVLSEESSWAFFTFVNWDVYPLRRDIIKCYFKEVDVDVCSAKPKLRVKSKVLRDFQMSTETITVIVALCDVHRFLDHYHVSSIQLQTAKIELKFSGADLKEEENLLDVFGDIRGFLDAKISTTNPGSKTRDRARLLKTPCKLRDEVLDRMSELQQLGNDAFSKGRVEEAHTFYERGLSIVVRWRIFSENSDEHEERLYIMAYLWLSRTICHYISGGIDVPDRFYGTDQFSPFRRLYRNERFALKSHMLFCEGFALWAGGFRLEATKTFMEVLDLEGQNPKLAPQIRTMRTQLRKMLLVFIIAGEKGLTISRSWDTILEITHVEPVGMENEALDLDEESEEDEDQEEDEDSEEDEESEEDADSEEDAESEDDADSEDYAESGEESE